MTSHIPQGAAHRRSLVSQVLVHWGLFGLLLCALLWLSARAASGSAGIDRYPGIIFAFIGGLVLSHIIHEWGHYLGAVLVGSRLVVKPRVHPLFFDFQYSENTPRQFIFLAWGGLAGNLLLLSALLAYFPSGTLIATSLVAAVAGQFVFVLILELPVSLGVLAGKDPLQTLTAHFSQGGPLFLRAAGAGMVTAALVFGLS